VGLPWQDRREKGLSVLKAVWRTILAVHQNPRGSFEELKRERGLGEPIIYQLWLLGAILVVTLPLQILSARFGAFPFMPGGMGGGQGAWHHVLVALVYVVIGIVSVGVTILWDLFVAWALNRLIVMLGGERAYVADTYCVLAYGTTSTRPWGLIPACGGLIALIWAIVIGLNGLSSVHRVSAGKAFLACLILFGGMLIVGVGIGVAIAGLVALIGNM
jgi:hypothetical protein